MTPLPWEENPRGDVAHLALRERVDASAAVPVRTGLLHGVLSLAARATRAIRGWFGFRGPPRPGSSVAVAGQVARDALQMGVAAVGGVLGEHALKEDLAKAQIAKVFSDISASNATEERERAATREIEASGRREDERLAIEKLRALSDIAAQHGARLTFGTGVNGELVTLIGGKRLEELVGAKVNQVRRLGRGSHFANKSKTSARGRPMKRSSLEKGTVDPRADRASPENDKPRPAQKGKTANRPAPDRPGRPKKKGT